MVHDLVSRCDEVGYWGEEVVRDMVWDIGVGESKGGYMGVPGKVWEHDIQCQYMVLEGSSESARGLCLVETWWSRHKIGNDVFDVF